MALDWQPYDATLVADPVASALASWARAADVRTAPIDPDVADTAAFSERYEIAMEDSANCVIVAGKRAGEVRYAACVVLATTRADVNNVVRRRLDVRKASFAAMDDATSRTGMEYGGITPIGLPAGWPVLIDAAVLTRKAVVVGSGLRRSKILLPPSALMELPAAELIESLAN